MRPHFPAVCGKSFPGTGFGRAGFAGAAESREWAAVRDGQTGSNIQKGYMQMLAGAMSALRNTKAHANITITKDDAMRRLMFASMLMYKIDEAIDYSEIQER